VRSSSPDRSTFSGAAFVPRFLLHFQNESLGEIFMKRLSIAAFLLAAVASIAFAANITLTPIVPPTETGENSAGSQQVTDMARMKPGSCTATTTGAEPNFTAVACNGAAGAVTTNANVTIAAVGGKDTVTITNTKVQAGDFVDCQLDSAGAAAGSTPTCTAVVVTAGQIVFTISNLTATSPAAALKLYFMVFTAGNPN
jgi:hypothetical protein